MEIREVIISSDSDNIDLYNMTLLCFNMIQRQAYKDKGGGFILKSTYTEQNEVYTCYTNGIIDFSCKSIKDINLHTLIKQKASE